ncbi:3343_t:CDS:1, partial [Gigaspora rosea]
NSVNQKKLTDISKIMNTKNINILEYKNNLRDLGNYSNINFYSDNIRKINMVQICKNL